MFQSKHSRMIRTIVGIGVAAILIVGCSSDSAMNTTSPSAIHTAAVDVTPDNSGLLQYSLSASDALGRTVYRERFTQAAVVSIQVTEPTMELAVAPTEEPSIATVPEDVVE